MNADLRIKSNAMAYPSRNHLNERTNLTLVDGGRRRKRRQSVPLIGRLLTTVAAVVLLVVVLKFFPPISRHSGVPASRGTSPAVASDLHLSGVQISRAPDGTALYLDGLVTNAGNSRVREATAEVGFRDAQGRLVASVRRPLVGMAHGGTDLIRNEFARNPITPKQMRFFRIAVEDVPPTWNQELPQLTIVDVKAQ